MKMIRSALSISFYTVISRATGFLRDIFMANFIGTGMVMDALVIAIKVPSFLRRIFAEGAFNSSFVPIFSSLQVQYKNEARIFAQDVLSLMTMILIVVVVVFEIFMPAILGAFLSNASPEFLKLAILFSRITFPFILLISLVALFSGVLNSLDRFTAAASSPVAGNLFIVACFLLFNPEAIASGENIALAIMGSGVVQLLWVAIPCWIYGIRPAFRMPKRSEHIRTFGRKMIPAAFGSGILQINLLIDMFIASLLPTGTYSYLYYADRLYHLPISVTGTAMGTVLLPLLSRLWRQNKTRESLHYQNRAIEFAMMITIPAMIGLILLAEPLVTALFQRGAFDGAATIAVSETVIGFATGLPAYILIKILSSNFFARQDTMTPIIVALISMVSNIVLNLLLIGTFQHQGIAIATSLSAWLGAGILYVLLYRKNHIRMDKHVGIYMGKILISCMAAFGYVVWVLSYGMSYIQTAITPVDKIYGVGILVIPTMAIYIIIMYMMKGFAFKDPNHLLDD